MVIVVVLVVYLCISGSEGVEGKGRRRQAEKQTSKHKYGQTEVLMHRISEINLRRKNNKF